MCGCKVVGLFQVCHQPTNLSAVESASLLYATMTAWSALYLTGGLCLADVSNAKVLILGASGGVGTAAVQLLKSQGAFVSINLLLGVNLQC